MLRGEWYKDSGDNVWFGGGVIVCAGVTVGENTVVAAGNPACVIRDLS